MATNLPDHFNVFYSWQSDLDKKANNFFIKDCLEKAIKELKKDDSITVIPRLDKDTKDASGSPKIRETILSKINASQIFIADITIINNSLLNKLLRNRLTPNPNVLFELGYALYRLSWDRIILLNNSAFSKIADMPFDLQQNRISQYYFNGRNKRNIAQKKLIDLLKISIKTIIDNYESILEKEQQGNIHQHDIRIFRGLDKILNDTKFISLLQHIANVQIVKNEEYDLLDEFIFYLTAERNKFLSEELNKVTEVLLTTINTMIMSLSITLYPKRETWYDEVNKEHKSHTIYHLPQDSSGFSNYNEFEEENDKRIDKNSKAIFNTIDEYKTFRSAIKRTLFI